MPLKYFILCISVVISSSVFSQNIYFKFKDGTTASFQVNEIRNITFNGDVMNLRKTDGTLNSWNVFNIGNYNYNIVTSIVEPQLNVYQIKVYPNPSSGSVHICYELPTTDQVSIEIFDMWGRNIKRWPIEKKGPGKHELIWHSSEASSLLPGTYVCHFTTSKGRKTQLIILE